MEAGGGLNKAVQAVSEPLCLRWRRGSLGPSPALIPGRGGAPSGRQLCSAPSISGPPGRPRGARPSVCRPQRRAASTPFPGVARSGCLRPTGHKPPARPAGTFSRLTPLAGFYRSRGAGRPGVWAGEAGAWARRGGGERSAKPRGELWRKVHRTRHLAVLGRRRPPVGHCAKLRPGFGG